MSGNHDLGSAAFDAGRRFCQPMLVERIRSYRFLPIDTYPRIVNLAQQPIGKAILLALFALLLPVSLKWAVPITIAAGACAYAGSHRNRVLTLATLTMMFLGRDWFGWRGPDEGPLPAGLAGWADKAWFLWPMLAAFCLFSLLAMYFVRRFRKTFVARHPIICMLALYGIIVTLACSGVLKGTAEARLWTFAAIFAAYFWFLCYALVDQRREAGWRPIVQLGVFHPFWGSTSTPFGKGAEYLRNVEANNQRDLAITQLKGLKLLMWVHVLSWLHYLLDFFAQRVFRVPYLSAAVDQYIAGTSYSWYICWASLIYSFFGDMLFIAIWGGPIVASARLAGYRLLRNTYRPLGSTTLVDFWNRYYFYYKELLVEMFFFPTFVRCFKTHTRLRLFFATIMAATVGNFIYHFVRDIGYYTRNFGFMKQLEVFQSLAFYCVVLGVGIGLSQMRIHRERIHHGWIRRQLIPSINVMGFYCILSVFAVGGQFSLMDRFSFLGHIFGVH
jgi:hypothetical protein